MYSSRAYIWVVPLGHSLGGNYSSHRQISSNTEKLNLVKSKLAVIRTHLGNPRLMRPVLRLLVRLV